MVMETKDTPPQIEIEEMLAPKISRFKESWRLFKRNKLAFIGLAIFVLFFLSAVLGLF